MLMEVNAIYQHYTHKMSNGVGLTSVDFLQSDVFLELSAESDLSSVFSTRAVVGQNKVRVTAVQNGEFTEWVGHGLVRPRHLQQKRRNAITLLSPLLFWGNHHYIHHPKTYIYTVSKPGKSV